jgi:hypothetical protein
VKVKGQARNRLTGIRTRGSPGPHEVARPIWPTDVLVSRRLLTGGRIGCLIGLAPGEPIVTQIRFDQAGCFWAAGTGVFKPASRASLSARNRAVFSRVAARAVSYSALACCPSRSCCSFFLKTASARSRARLTSVSNLVTPFRANPFAGQTFLPEDRITLVDVGSSTEQRRPKLFVPRAPRAGPISTPG